VYIENNNVVGSYSKAFFRHADSAGCFRK